MAVSVLLLSALAVQILGSMASLNPRITTNNGNVNVELLSGSAFSVKCPNGTSPAVIPCEGDSVEISGGICRAKSEFATKDMLDAQANLTTTQMDLLRAELMAEIMNATSGGVRGGATGGSPLLTYIAWYGLDVSILAPVAGSREIRAYGPGLKDLYFPGAGYLINCTATNTTDASHMSYGKGMVMYENNEYFISCMMRDWLHGDASGVRLAFRFLPDGGLDIPFKGVTGADTVLIARHYTTATIGAYNEILVWGSGFVGGRSYACALRDGTFLVQQAATVVNSTLLNCSLPPTTFAVRHEDGLAFIEVDVEVLEDSTSMLFGGESGDNVAFIDACSDGYLNGNETDLDCGGPICRRCSRGEVCIVDSDCGGGDACSYGICQQPSYSSCQAALTAGQTRSGIYALNITGNVTQEYCDQEHWGGGWLLVMKVTDMDDNIDFLMNSPGWRSAGYSTLEAAGVGSCVGPLSSCTWTTDYVGAGYQWFNAQNIMMRESLTGTQRSIYSSSNCLNNRGLRAYMLPTVVDGGRACCNIAGWGAGTRSHGGVRNIVISGDESGDTEPSRIGLRRSCAGDSEVLMLGEAQTGGDRSGHKEVHSQSSYWLGLKGMWIFTK